MNNLERKEIIPENIGIALKLISTHCPTAVIGGSVALNAVGLLNREVHDIDIFIGKHESLNKCGLQSISSFNEEDELSSTVTNINGEEIQRTAIRINGIKCCVFKVNAKELEHSVNKLHDINVKIQSVNYALMAKIYYCEHNTYGTTKHLVDLTEVNNLLKSF